MEYVARFEVSEITGQSEEQKKQNATSDTTKSVEKKGIDTKQVGTVLTLASTSAKLGLSMYNKIQSVNNSIRGDSVAQNHLNNQMAYLNEGLTAFQTIGIAGIVGGGAGLAAGAVGYGVSKMLQAFNVAEENRGKQSQWQIEAINNTQKQARLVQDIAGVRV